MPPEIQNGKAILFGIGNSGSPIGLLGYATFVLETTKGGHKFKLTAVEDEFEFDVALIATNGHVEIDITWTPAGATRTAAATTVVFLPPLSKVTLSNYKVAAFNGDWIYVGDESIDLSHGISKMSLKIRHYDDAGQNASLVTTVAG